MPDVCAHNNLTDALRGLAEAVQVVTFVAVIGFQAHFFDAVRP